MASIHVLTFDCPFCGGTYLREHEGLNHHVTQECSVFTDPTVTQVNEVREYRRCAIIFNDSNVPVDAFRIDDNGMEIRFISNEQDDLDDMVAEIHEEIKRLNDEAHRLTDVITLVSQARGYRGYE